MKKALIKIHNIPAGIFIEENSQLYFFEYFDDYTGPAISLTIPITQSQYKYYRFPPFFDGLLPEGIQLEAVLKAHKIDKHDYFQQLIITGSDLVGAVTVENMGLNDE